MILILCGIILSRLIPHPADMTPIIAFSIFLASQSRYAQIAVLSSFFTSDLFLSFIYHYPLFGTWSIFNYSAMAIIILASQYFRCYKLNFGLGSTLFFWIWTNLDVWLSANMYPMNIQGLSACYIAAIPFLINSLLGTVMGYALLKMSPIAKNSYRGEYWRKMLYADSRE
jgi:hypothetical protein